MTTPGTSAMPATDVTVVDAHAHAMPKPLLKELERRGLAELGPLAEGAVVLDRTISGLPTRSPTPCPPAQHDLDAKLSHMDAEGRDVELVSPPPFVCATTTTDDGLAQEVARESNDAVADLARESGDRVRAVGFLPLGRPGATDEARRCLDELDCVALTIPTTAAGRELDDEALEETWSYLAGRGVPVLVHPSGGLGVDRMRSHHLPQLLGFPFDTTLAVVRMILGGVLDRHDLTLVIAHGGGCLGALRGRLDQGWEHKPVTRTCDRRPSAYLAELYYDTAVFDPVALVALVEMYGSGQLVLGTDAPFDVSDRQPLATVDALGLPPHEHRAVLGATVAGLLSDRRGA